MKCKYCLDKDAIKYSKYSKGEFCSKVCANSFSSTINKEQKNKKISDSLKGNILSEEQKLKISKTMKKFSNIPSNKLRMSERSKNFWNNNPEHRKVVSEFIKNRPIKDETRKKLSDLVNARIAAGVHTGWAKRGKPSYPEIFFKGVLENNNIIYEFEKPVGKYFIDFAIEDKMIALEIDGGQHKLPERKIKDDEKDNYLISIGWKVYRIPWNSINYQGGKEMMKYKIDKFLNYYMVV